MLIGVLADSHDHLDNLRLACRLFQAHQVQAIIHAGDYVAPFTLPILGQLRMPLYGVRGNNDGEVAGLSERFASLGGHFYTHPQDLVLGGQRILIQHEPFALQSRTKGSQTPQAQSEDLALSLIVYGHTHQAEFRPGSNCQPAILNPGETCGWLYGSPTAAVYDTADSTARIYPLT